MIRVFVVIFLSFNMSYATVVKIGDAQYNIKSYLEKNYLIQKPKKQYYFKIEELNKKREFVRVDVIAVYNDGSYVENKYIPDMAFTLCLEKKDNKYKVLYDLSRTDVPSSQELKSIKKDFPIQFPKKLLSKFWQDLL